MTTRTQENLAGLRVIRAYGQEAHERKRFEEANREYVERNRSYVAIQAAFRPAITAVMGLGTVAMLFVGGELIIRGTITIGAFTAFSIYMTMLIWPAVSIGWVTGLFQRGAASMKRFKVVLDAEPDIRDLDDAAPLPEDAPGRIAIRNLTFRYDEDGPEVLKNVSLDIEPGTTTAILGATGSGKIHPHRPAGPALSREARRHPRGRAGT